MVSRTRHAEIVQLVLLLLLDGVFYVHLIPAGIVDPAAFGMDEGLPPSFSARLVAVLAGMLMLGRLIQLLASTPPPEEKPAAVPDAELNLDAVIISPRSVAGIAAALVFAGVLAPYLGFLTGGAILLLALLAITGERRPLRMLLSTACVMLLVWLLFEQLLSIRLPVGALFAQ
jgi:hypothetical protein